MKKTLRSTPGLRRKIKKLYAANNSIKKICQTTGASYFQVYNVINGRVKMDGGRGDKGMPRVKSQQQDMAGKSMQEFGTVEEFLEYQLIEASKDLSRVKMITSEKIKLIKDIANIQKNITAVKIESWIKKPEAILIVKIMKRLGPKLTEDEMKKIYTEEYEKLVRGID